MKVAIVHDWLTGMRGGEKCLEVFCELFPEATLFTLVHDKGSVSSTIENMDIRTSFLQRIPGITENYRNYLMLFPRAIESFDLSDYDLILSSSHCVAKGVRNPKGALHVCYCYTPVRYAWKFFDEYFSGEGRLKKWVISKVVNRIKRWDVLTSKRVDYFIAISDNIKKRIKEYYGREADVIYPPANMGAEDTRGGDEGYYLIVSALVPYKRVDLAVEAFSETGRSLVIVGSGGELERLKKKAGKNIEFSGWVGDTELSEYYAKCRALVFPGEEDFGIVPVEAQGYGKPVVAFGAGGALETIIPLKDGQSGATDATGVFFYEQSPEALNEALDKFENNSNLFDPDRIKDNARPFNRDRFKGEISSYLEEKLCKEK